MIHGIRTVHLAPFASCALLVACRQAPDPAQLTAVDQLISATDAAVLTLNELDRGRYRRSDSLFRDQQAGFASLFEDTLGRHAATVLADQYIALRASAAMGSDHERLLADITSSSERLRVLRSDLSNGSIQKEKGALLIGHEQQRHTAIIEEVHHVIDNYRTLQQAWDRRDTVAVLLSEANPSTAP